MIAARLILFAALVALALLCGYLSSVSINQVP